MAEPLTSQELETLTQWIETTDNRNVPTRLAVKIIPHTGLYTGEFSHLQRDWIDFPADDDEPILIKIPEEAECPEIAYRGSEIVSDPDPCKYCRSDGRNGKWEPVNKYRVRHIPVQSREAKEFLKSWFDRYESIPASLSISNNVQASAEASPLNRTVTALDLRLTYPAQLAAMGFEREFIVNVCGYQPDSRDQSGSQLHDVLKDYGLTTVGKRDSDEVLAALRSNGPLTNRELADHLDWPYPTVCDHTRKLYDSGKITTVKDYNPKNGGLPTRWKLRNQSTND